MAPPSSRAYGLRRRSSARVSSSRTLRRSATPRMYSDRRSEAPYYQPLPQRVTPETWGPTRVQRRQSEVCRLEQSAEVTERPNGFAVRIRAEGTAGVPLAVEICFREGGTLDGCRTLRATPGSYVLPVGTATYRAGANQIRFGPGDAAHEYVQLRGA